MKTPRAFRDSLPRTPILDHVCQIHTVLFYMHGRGDGHDISAVEIAEHSLRKIAIWGLSMMNAEDAYTEQMRWQMRWQYGATRSAPFVPSDIITRMQRSVRESFAENDRMSRARRREHWTEQDSLNHMARMGRIEMNAARHHLHAEVIRVRKELGL